MQVVNGRMKEQCIIEKSGGFLGWIADCTLDLFLLIHTRRLKMDSHEIDTVKLRFNTFNIATTVMILSTTITILLPKRKTLPHPTLS